MIDLTKNEQVKTINMILSALPDGVAIYDVSGRILYANRLYRESIGLKQSDIVGETLGELRRPPEVYSDVEAQIKEVVTTGRPVVSKLDIHALCEMRHFEYAIEPLFRKDGSVGSVVVTARDVTEQRRAADEIRESRKQVLDMLESIADGFFALDNDWRFTYVNRKAEELIGIERENLLYRNIWQVITEEEASKAYEQYNLAKQQKELVSYEEFIPRLNRWLDVNVYPFDNGVTVYIKDITGRKRSEETHRKSEEKYRRIVDTATEGIWALGSDTVTTFVNARMAEMLGYSGEEMIGRSMTDFMYEEDTPDHLQKMENRRQGISENYERRFRRRDGQTVWTLVSATPVFDEEHNFNGSFAMFTDTTESKRIENIMKARLRLLEFSTSHSMDEFLTATLDEIEALTGSNIGFYHFLESDQKTLSLQSWSTNTLKTMCTAAGKGSHYDVAQAGVWVDCVHERHPVIHNDYASLPHRKGMPEGHAPVVREVVVPIFRGNMIKAIIGVGNKPTNYNETDIDTLSQLGDLSWDITERKRAEEELHRLNRELRAITDCNQALVRTEDEQTLLNEICRIICDEAGYRMVWVGYAEYDDTKTVRPVAWAGVEDGYLASINISWADTECGLGPTGTAIRSGESVCMQDIASDLQAIHWRGNAMRQGYRSGIALPLKDERGNTFGAISIYSEEPNIFTPDEIRLMDELAGDLAFGITTLRARAERKQVEEALRESEEKYRTIFQNSPLGIYRSTFEGRFLEVNPALAKMLGYDSPETVIRETHDIAKQICVRVEERQGIVAGQLGLADITRHTSRYRRRDGSEFTANLYLRTIRDVEGRPIFYEGIVEDITEHKEKERFSNTLNEINASISSTLDFDEIMQRVIDKAATAIGTETGAIIFRDEDRWLTKYSYGYKENIIGEILTDEDAPHAALAARIKKPVVINDAYNDPDVNLKIMKRYNIRSVITVPLIARDTTIGILFLNYHTAPVAFTEAQIDFASKLSVSVSLAIENARLYEAERNIADTLQEALLTMPEHIEGMEYDYLYRSATEATKVGGDFFDIFELEHDRIGIIVGDVSGKGLQAASLTSLVKNTVRIYAYDEALPAVIMRKTNDAVRKSIPASNFITLFLVIIDMKSGTLTYCSAGHPPALLKRGSSVELLSENSPILGAFAGLNYTQGDILIKEGDVLVLYTDGITEARCDEEFFGEERLVNFVKRQTEISAKDFPQVIFDEVMRCTHGKLSDDVVLLALALR